MTPGSRTSRSRLPTRRCTAFATPSRARPRTTRPAPRGTSSPAAARTPLSGLRKGAGDRALSFARILSFKTQAASADRNNVTERVRIFAAAGLVAVLALGGGFMLLGRGQGTSPAATKVIKPLHAVKKRTHKAVVPKKTHAAPKAKPTPKPKFKPKPSRPVIDGMPAAVALALQSYPVVVVSLYAPDSAVDKLATAEAREGAATAGVGFV